MTKLTIESQLGSWADTELVQEFKKPYMRQLRAKLKVERLYGTVRPDPEDVFKAYRLSPPNEVKVVILGMDPYPHDAANGLAFSVKEEATIEVPKSLQNIFAELEDDIGFQPYHNPDLTRWAKQGVMLLNTRLTVRHGMPGSHKEYGWQFFTKKTLEIICNQDNPTMFILWGNFAQEYADIVVPPHNYTCAPHPSPLSAYRGFFGSKPFSTTNRFLENNNRQPIDWLKNE